MDTFVWEQLDFQEVQRAVDDILNGSFQFRDTVLELISGEQPFTLDGFLRAVLQQAGTDWRTEKYILVSILVLGIAAALLTGFTDIFQNRQAGETGFEITYLLLFLTLMQVFSGATELTEQVLTGILEFMKALLPAWCLAVTLAAGSTTALVFYQFLLGLIYLLEWLIREWLLTLIQVYLILVFVNHMTKEEYLSQMTEMTGKAVGWILKSLLAVVVGFHTIQGLISPAVDAVRQTAFSQVFKSLPGIGNAAGSVTELLLGSAVLIKNGIGAAALVVLVLLCLTPLVKLGVLMLILKGAAALVQPVSDKRIVGCVAGAGEGICLLLQLVFTVLVLFVIAIVVVTVSVRGGL